MKKILMAFAVIMLAVCAGSVTPVNAESPLNINDQDIVLTSSGSYHIIGNGTETANHILVKDGVTANIILENVKIKSSDYAFKIEKNSGGDVSITLVGDNSLIGNNAPGIWKDGDGDNVGRLTISGSGSLHAENQSGDGAGIGSQNGTNTRNIVIESGTIFAKAGTYGAGIGGGGGGGCAKDITINGGNITAVGGTAQGAGIGGGSDRIGGDGYAEGITITGGTVKATAPGRGAGIGGGHGYGSDITITGGVVIATGSSGAADIGGGQANTRDENGLIQTVEVKNSNGDPATNNIANALTYSKGTYSVKGKIDLTYNLTVAGNETLVIETDAVLTVSASLINDGIFENHGSIIEPNGHSPREDDGDCTTPVYCKACQGIAVPAKEHQFSVVQYDESFHWYGCENENCLQISGKESHQAGDWLIDEEATVDHEGKKHKECTVCHYVMETETIAKKSAEENEASVDNAAEDKVSSDSIVETGESRQEAVKTADESNAYIYIALMAASLAGCALALERKKLKKNS